MINILCKFILLIVCVFLEKLKSMIHHHTCVQNRFKMTGWLWNVKWRLFQQVQELKYPRTPHWNSTQSWKYHIDSKEYMLLLTCTASHVQGLASVWMQSCHGHSWSCLSCWFFSILSSPVGSVNRFFLASIGLAVVIVCVILRPEMEWLWLGLILILKRTVFLIKFWITHRLHARTAGCSTPPRRCRRYPAPAPPQGRATRAVTTSCVGFAGPWTPTIWGT